MLKLRNYIHGDWVEPASQKYLTKINPATAQPIYELPDSSELDVIKAIQAAHLAFESWSRTTIETRSRLLLRLADLIESMADDLAEYESQDVGKPIELAKSMDIARAVLNFRFFATRMLHSNGQSTEVDGKFLNYTVRQPVGVVGLISPWNLPLYLLTWKIAPALMCGNTVVCKPSELSSRTAYELSLLMKEAGIPSGVCNFVFGRGEVAGQTLVSHPGVRAISFTGGTETGEAISRIAAPQFKKLSLELGGKNSALIFADADVTRAVLGTVRSSFLNQGEICLCTSRIFVQEEIFDSFLEAFVREVDDLTIGDPLDNKTFMGPLVSKEHFEKVQGCVERAQKDGAKVANTERELRLPEHLKNGYFMRPKVLVELSNCSEIHHTEIFGPVVTVQPFQFAPDALKFANSTPYGLAATVWTQDIGKAHRVAQSLQVGTVWVNTWLQRDLRMPFGGVKASGIGREGGDHSFEFFTDTKTVCVSI